MAKVARGDLWVVNLEPGFGREIHKKRPAVIVSPERVNEGGIHVIIIPASTTMPPKIGTEMVLCEETAGLHKPSVFLSLFIRSIDQGRLVEKIGFLPDEKMQEVEEALKLVLGLVEIN